MPDDLAIIYRTTGAWGAGKGSRLTKVEVDENMWAFAQAIVDLQNDRPEPAEISSIDVNGRFMTIHLSSGANFGPFPLPITEFRFRDEWTPSTVYDPLDWFTVSGSGIYTVIYGHTSGAEFDPNILVDGLPALKKLFGPDAGSVTNSIVYDVEFLYEGHLSDIAGPLNFLAMRQLLLPAAGPHQAYIATPASAHDQVLPVMHNETQIGTVTFPVDSNAGTVAITVDETILLGDRLAIGAPGTIDGVAAQMTIGLSLQRILA